MDNQEKRDKFNRLLKSLDLVLMNNIPEVDPSIWDNFEGKSPLTSEPCDWFLNDSKPEPRWCCATHQYEGEEEDTEAAGHDDQCPWAEDDASEVYQWFACNESDAHWLKRHNQFVTYSDLLDTHFLAICHFGTAWDYVDSMVDDFTKEV